MRWPSWLVVEFFRAVPLLMLILLHLGPAGVSDWTLCCRSSSGLILYNGSVLAEVFRAGINAVPKGQAEAAYAIGMRKNQVMRIILLPQAVKIMLPAIISQCIVALKDTSLGFYILAPGPHRRRAADLERTFHNKLATAIVLAADLHRAEPAARTASACWLETPHEHDGRPGVDRRRPGPGAGAGGRRWPSIAEWPVAAGGDGGGGDGN